MNQYESKITARVDAVLANEVQKHFHYGQQTQLFRHFFTSLNNLIKNGKFDEITDYLYKGQPLSLPEVKDE